MVADQWTFGRAGRRADGRTDGRADERTDGRTGGRASGRTGGHTDLVYYFYHACACMSLHRYEHTRCGNSMCDTPVATNDTLVFLGSLFATV